MRLFSLISSDVQHVSFPYFPGDKMRRFQFARNQFSKYSGTSSDGHLTRQSPSWAKYKHYILIDNNPLVSTAEL